MINIPNDTNSSKCTIADRIKSLACKIKSKLFLSEASYLWLSFLIPVVIMYFIYLGLKIHPFGDGSVLVLDLNAQYVYFYEALREFIWGDQSLLYSFGRQLGGEFMGIYGYYLASPFSYSYRKDEKGPHSDSWVGSHHFCLRIHEESRVYRGYPHFQPPNHDK